MKRVEAKIKRRAHGIGYVEVQCTTVTKEIYRVVVVVGLSLSLFRSTRGSGCVRYVDDYCGSVPPQMYRRMRHVGNGPPTDNGHCKKELTVDVEAPRMGVHESIPQRVIRRDPFVYRLPGDHVAYIIGLL